MRGLWILAMVVAFGCNEEPVLNQQEPVNSQQQGADSETNSGQEGQEQNGEGQDNQGQEVADAPTFADFNTKATEFCSCHAPDSVYQYKIDNEQLTVDNKAQLINRIENQTMPPAESGQLAADDRTLMLDYLNSI